MMLFKTKISTKDIDFTMKSSSGLIKFIEDDENLENEVTDFEHQYHLKINGVHKNNFLNEKSDKLKFYNFTGNPDLVIIYKVKKEDISTDYFRNILAKTILEIKDENIENLHIMVPFAYKFNSYFKTEDYYYRTLVEGVLYGNYSFEKYKSEKKDLKKLNIVFHTTNREIFKKAVDISEEIMDAVGFTRDLVNEPAITLTPVELAKRTKDKLSSAGVKVTIFDKKDLESKKLNSILAVGNGSSNEPKLIVMEYHSKDAEKTIAFVGKGVTYDSGGYSIKPTSGMVEMKGDMAGGAMVIGSVLAAAKAKLPVNVIGIVPAVENMVSGHSYKPGDIISTMNGKTIEVLDTDAEGRLVLADALEYACSLKPDSIIDFATLTGACVVGLGEYSSGVMSDNQEIIDRIVEAGKETYEFVWPLPFFKEYKKLLDSDIADIKNLGPRWGGAITAGKFLQFFVDKEIAWAHVDIAGPALKNKFTSYTEKWDTGYGVRLMTEYLRKL